MALSDPEVALGRNGADENEHRRWERSAEETGDAGRHRKQTFTPGRKLLITDVSGNIEMRGSMASIFLVTPNNRV
jgi:hypothetical protein